MGYTCFIFPVLVLSLSADSICCLHCEKSRSIPILVASKVESLAQFFSAVAHTAGIDILELQTWLTNPSVVQWMIHSAFTSVIPSRVMDLHLAFLHAYGKQKSLPLAEVWYCCLSVGFGMWKSVGLFLQVVMKLNEWP